MRTRFTCECGGVIWIQRSEGYRHVTHVEPLCAKWKAIADEWKGEGERVERVKVHIDTGEIERPS